MVSLTAGESRFSIGDQWKDFDGKPDVLILEPFHDGSHKQLLDTILNEVDGSRFLMLTMSGKKWHWRARNSGLYFAGIVPRLDSYRVLFATSVMNLADFIALRPEFNRVAKILYFHENELNYPIVNPKERDFYYGTAQIISCLVADIVLFNSGYNLESFLNATHKHFNMMPDYLPDVSEMVRRIRGKAHVLHFPVKFPVINAVPSPESSDRLLHILWPHRWEHDKGGDIFFECLRQLKKTTRFKVSILGQKFSEVPEAFITAREEFKDEILHWGFLDQKKDYWEVLKKSDVVVSTSLHEFFGVSMVEAAIAGCFPLCPNRLSYPEIFPKECLYNTENQLRRRLENFCGKPSSARNESSKLGISCRLKANYSAEVLSPIYRAVLGLEKFPGEETGCILELKNCVAKLQIHE
ncbi:unnamed protein product [Notodromas monacha]|uniref:tRNA-queuosine alpha-mannosyltransferase n=1 Tax=Notodromas monacha TaxID=399045 RepID=A0A7R9BHI2_9CRUS|nr:unnamed protein product [Notodromas monacha]CAG0914021.1 unnamed protein product [Notodromas monacha]